METISTFIALVIAIITAYFLYCGYTRQGKKDSILFTLDHIEKMLNRKNNKKIIDILYDTKNKKKINSVTDDEIEWFLNDLENIMLIKAKNLISKEDIIYQFGTGLLKLIKKQKRFITVRNNIRVQMKDCTLYKNTENFFDKL